MNFTLEALGRLSVEEQVIRHRAALPPVNGFRECQQLEVTLQNLSHKLSVFKLDRPKLNAELVWKVFAGCPYAARGLRRAGFERA